MADVEGTGSIFVEEKFLRACFKDGVNNDPNSLSESLKGVITSPYTVHSERPVFAPESVAQ